MDYFSEFNFYVIKAFKTLLIIFFSIACFYLLFQILLALGGLLFWTFLFSLITAFFLKNYARIKINRSNTNSANKSVNDSIIDIIDYEDKTPKKNYKL